MISSRPSDGESYVGRAAELAAARGAIAEAASEGASLVWIEGEAGAGKTALIAKITAELAARGSLLRMAADENAGFG
jgi:tRNA A37 threonylcarbamoyladenosine biosynthesis protein TsaE